MYKSLKRMEIKVPALDVSSMLVVGTVASFYALIFEGCLDFEHHHCVWFTPSTYNIFWNKKVGVAM